MYLTWYSFWLPVLKPTGSSKMQQFTNSAGTWVCQVLPIIGGGKKDFRWQPQYNGFNVFLRLSLKRVCKMIFSISNPSCMEIMSVCVLKLSHQTKIQCQRSLIQAVLQAYFRISI